MKIVLIGLLSVFSLTIAKGQNLITNKGVKWNVAGGANITIDSTTTANTLTINGAAGTSNTVTEKKTYYRGEIYYGQAINTTTGALSEDTSRSVTDYLVVAPSESITISSSTGATFVVYGWTYDTSLVAISAIRSSGLIGTPLSTYTFTTPANAKYLMIYIRYASVDFHGILRIESTSTITYTTPITPEQFAGTTSQKIQQAVDYARFTSSGVELKGYYLIDSTIILSSGSRLILNGATVQLNAGTHDNLVRNEAVRYPSWHKFNRGNRDIKIIGIGNAVFQGSTENWGGDTPAGGVERWRSHGIRLANVDNLVMSGITMQATNANAIDFEQVRHFFVDNIYFIQNLEHLNQGGLELLRGTHDGIIQNLRGKCTDDMLAFVNIKGNEGLHILGFTVYDPGASNLDICNISYKNIQRDNSQLFQIVPPPLFGNAIRYLTSDTLKIHDISGHGISGYQNIFLQDPSSAYALATVGGVGDMYNITITDAENSPVYFFGPVTNSSFINVAATDTSGVYPACLPTNGSLNIYRKYYGSAPQFISTVIGGVETITTAAVSTFQTPVINGGTAANDDLTIQGTTNATRATSYVNLQPNGGLVGIGTAAPAFSLDIINNQNAATAAQVTNTTDGTGALSFMKFVGVSGRAANIGLIAPSVTGAFAEFAGKFFIEPNQIGLTHSLVLSAPDDGIKMYTGGRASSNLRWSVNSSGHFLAGTDNSFDIGASGATRPRSGYFGTSIFAPLLVGGTGTTSTLTLQTTSGSGTTGSDIIFKDDNTEFGRFLNNGNFGIGTNNPTNNLYVQTTANGSGLSINAQTTGYPAMGFRVDDVLKSLFGASRGTSDLITGSAAGDFNIRAQGTNVNFSTTSGSTIQMKIAATTGAVQMTNYGAGTATFDASGNITSVSDERLKTNIKPYKTGLKELMNIKPITYKWNAKSGMETKGNYAGFSAQNVKANIPLGTGEDSKGYLSLQDRALLATMVNAIQEQQKQIEELKEEVKKLKSK